MPGAAKWPFLPVEKASSFAVRQGKFSASLALRAKASRIIHFSAVICENDYARPKQFAGFKISIPKSSNAFQDECTIFY